MRQIAEFVTVLSRSLFTGASVYINLVEHPALYLAKGNLLSLPKKCLVGEICGSPLHSKSAGNLACATLSRLCLTSVACCEGVTGLTGGFGCRLRSKVFFAHLKPWDIGNLRPHPCQGRNRQRTPRLNGEIPSPVQRPTRWRTGGDRR